MSYNSVFEILTKAYYDYKKYLYFIKELIVLKQFEYKNKELDKLIDLRNNQFVKIYLSAFISR